MRPSRQTMRHCCQLIPLQITPPFIVSSLASSPSPSFSRPRSLFHPVSQPRCCWSPLSFLSPGCKLSLPLSLHFPLYFPLLSSASTLCLSLLIFLLSLCVSFPLFPSFFNPFSSPFASSFSRSLFCAVYPRVALSSTVLSRRGGLFFTVGRCTWDRGDKRNCANKYAPVDNCSINRSWMVKRGRLNAPARLEYAINVL